MSNRWQLGSYTFVINPNKNGEQYTFVGDNVVALDGTIISQPTTVQEQYTFSSVFFQGMPKVTNQVSIPNLGGIEMLSGNYYVLNDSTDKIDVYNTNYSLLKSISLLDSGNANFVAFDVQSNETIWAIEQPSGLQILHTVTSSSKTTRNIQGLSGNITGIKYDNTSGDLWLVTDSDVLYKTDTNLNIIASMNLPYVSPTLEGYKGMTMINGYLVISFNNTDMNGAYHIDTSTGNIVNAFSLPTSITVTDVTFDGKNFIFSTNTDQLIFTNGNTILVDIHSLEKQIRENGYLVMIDDMGVSRNVVINQYNISRQDGFLQMYNIDFTSNRVDRGSI